MNTPTYWRNITPLGFARGVSHIWTIAKREVGGYFSSPIAYVFIVIFLLLAGFFTFMVGGFFERGQANLRAVLCLASVVLSVSRAGGRHALVGRRTARGHDRTPAHHADHAVAGDRRKISRVLVVPRARARADLSDRHHRELSWTPRQRRDLRRATSAACLIAGAYLVDLAMTSAMTRNQVVSFIISVVICLFLVLAGFRR